jgi:hypothetical protein
MKAENTRRVLQLTLKCIVGILMDDRVTIREQWKRNNLQLCTCLIPHYAEAHGTAITACRWKRCAACNKLYAVRPSLLLRVLSIAFHGFQCTISHTLSIAFLWGSVYWIYCHDTPEDAILTSYGRVLEKPPVVHLLKISPIFYGTRRFITVFTIARQWYLSWARWISSHFSNIHHNVIISTSMSS